MVFFKEIKKRFFNYFFQKIKKKKINMNKKIKNLSFLSIKKKNYI